MEKSIDIFNLIIHIISFHFLGALDNPCSLSCMPKNEFFYQTFKEKVDDGTRCTEHSYDMCVDGVCMVNSKLNGLFLNPVTQSYAVLGDTDLSQASVL